MALSAHLGSIEAEKQKLRAQVSFCGTRTLKLRFTPVCLCCFLYLKLFRPLFVLPFCPCSFASYSFVCHITNFFPSLPTSSSLLFLILALTHHLCFLLSFSSGATSVSGEPVVKRRAGWSSAATAGQGAGGRHTGGTEQAPAVHVLHTQIRLGGATVGEKTSCTQTKMSVCGYVQEEFLNFTS